MKKTNVIDIRTRRRVPGKSSLQARATSHDSKPPAVTDNQQLQLDSLTDLSRLMWQLFRRRPVETILQLLGIGLIFLVIFYVLPTVLEFLAGQ